ncbi:MAG: hypothetical protein H6668_00060 [Ardenticatenaceae bacterium]|nr:hypothetical protein [Ardenticatenaceae bacterium]
MVGIGGVAVGVGLLVGVATAVSHLQNSLHWYAEFIPPTAESKNRALTPELIDAILRAGLAAVANQQPTQAATLFTAVTRFASTMNHFPPPPLAQAMSEAETAVRATLSSVEWETAVAKGHHLSLTDILTQFSRHH